ncbi:ras association domain-containing protein 8-like isoform X1 [Pundamilia nyererei]|uniref:Ras association domain-containing protein 8-like isoform X1 n=1 Tax=Pundamilia nyererei TaxID=303518 RepID=A0A9Y3S0K9_9CICH|nr:PREDICTED: ras association domain-containing protein 8-like isoform X1 [Pundamilia nyererei]XP_005747647.1 PREDICTED: ras association domain-containing protein 8-like isoform X1 [Pundamilia nyererei]
MELKVWVEGVVRVVSGLSLNTSCQDVVIALAQAIGQTGRYILILKLRGNERHLVADDCPLQHLAQLGQLATEVQFVLRRTGPSLSEGPDTSANERRLPLSRPSEPEPLKRREPQKALTFSLGPSTLPKRNKPKKDWSRSPRSSPELRASPVSFLDPVNSMKTNPSYPKDEVFRDILQQQRRLQDLEIQLQDLERETELWEQKWSSPEVTLAFAEELEELQWRVRQNEVELMQTEDWEKALQAEMEREQGMHRRLDQIHSSINDQSYEITTLQTRSAHLEEDLQVRVQTQSSLTAQQDESLKSLKQELHNRLQLGEELDVRLAESQQEMETAEERVKDRLEIIEELNKELRQCNLQQFIQQTGVTSQTEQTNLPVNDVYLNNAGIRE